MSIAHNVCDSNVTVCDYSPDFLPRNSALDINALLSAVAGVMHLHDGDRSKVPIRMISKSLIKPTSNIPAGSL